MSNEAPNWSEQWGGGGARYGDWEDNSDKPAKKGGNGKKMAEMKATASAGLDKARTTAAVGAQKVKSGTVVGFKWMKEQYQKRGSSSKGK